MSTGCLERGILNIVCYLWRAKVFGRVEVLQIVDWLVQFNNYILRHIHKTVYFAVWRNSSFDLLLLILPMSLELYPLVLFNYR